MILLTIAVSLVLVSGQGLPRQSAAEDPQLIFDRAIADFMAGRVRASLDGFNEFALLLPETTPRRACTCSGCSDRSPKRFTTAGM